jgi:hypothetical protein
MFAAHMTIYRDGENYRLRYLDGIIVPSSSEWDDAVYGLSSVCVYVRNPLFKSFFSFLGRGETESTWYVSH